MYTLETLFLGQQASFSKTISESDIYQFAGITGDLNPVHVDEVYASKTRFGKRIAHGMLSSSFICTVLGTKLPGQGTIHVSQSLEFKRPVYIMDTLLTTLSVTDIDVTRKLVKIHCVVTNQNNEVVVEGTAVVKPPKPA